MRKRQKEPADFKMYVPPEEKEEPLPRRVATPFPPPKPAAKPFPAPPPKPIAKIPPPPPPPPLPKKGMHVPPPLPKKEKERGISLVPSAEEAAAKRASPSLFLLVLFIAIAAAALSYIGMFWYQRQMGSRALAADKKIVALKQALAGVEQEKTGMQKTQTQLQAVQTLLEQHLYWSNLFKFLEENTIPDVYYQNFNADAEGKATLGARAANFSSVAKQLAAFQENPLVREVKVSHITSTVDRLGKITEVSFGLTLQLFPEVFLKK